MLHPGDLCLCACPVLALRELTEGDKPAGEAFLEAAVTCLSGIPLDF